MHYGVILKMIRYTRPREEFLERVTQFPLWLEKELILESEYAGAFYQELCIISEVDDMTNDQIEELLQTIETVPLRVQKLIRDLILEEVDKNFSPRLGVGERMPLQEKLYRIPYIRMISERLLDKIDKQITLTKNG